MEDIPLPVPTLLSRPFWDGCRNHVLMIQRCEECGKGRFYPSEACQFCASTRTLWVQAAGTGRVHIWTVIHRSVDEAWQKKTPYVAAVVALTDYPDARIPGLLIGIAPSAVVSNLPVRIGFEDVTAEHTAFHWWADPPVLT